SHAAIVRRIVAAVAGAQTPPVIQLCCPNGAESRSLAAKAAGEMQLHLLTLEAEAIPQSSADAEAFTVLCDREAALTGSALFIEASEIDAADARAVRHVTRMVDRGVAPLFLATRERWRTAHRRVSAFDVGRPTQPEQLAAWHAAIGPAAQALNGDLHRVAAQFDL